MEKNVILEGFLGAIVLAPCGSAFLLTSAFDSAVLTSDYQICISFHVGKKDNVSLLHSILTSCITGRGNVLHHVSPSVCVCLCVL